MAVDNEVEPGASADVKSTAPDGDVDFVCAIHEADGMVGTISAK